MAPDKPKPLRNDAVEAAISRVLEAEVAARGAVAAARAEATVIAERARDSARRLALHTDARIRRIRGAFAATTSAEVAAMEAAGVSLGIETGLSAAEAAQVEAAVAALAGNLTGAAP